MHQIAALIPYRIEQQPAKMGVAGLLLRAAGLLVAGMFAPRAWPVVRAAAIVSHPAVPPARKVMELCYRQLL